MAVLLTHKADSPELTGTLTRLKANGDLYLWFEYGVVRLWEIPPDVLLQSNDLAVLPLLPLCRVTESELPGIIRQMEARLANAPTETARTLWASTYLLMGVSYAAEFVDNLLKEVQHLQDSSTYQALLARGREAGLEEGREEGRIKEARELILRLGSRRFGTPDAHTTARLNQTHDSVRLNVWADRLLEVENWNELLA